MNDQTPREAALDDLEENPDDFAGEEVTPEHTLDVSAFADEPDDQLALEVIPSE